MSPALPVGTRLLHIGPAKTGTTTLQSAFHHNRAAIAAQGVHYAGQGTQPRAAAAAVALRKQLPGHRRGLEAWPELVEEVRRSTADRVVISSETFARCGPKGMKTVVDAFGADRTQVVITMRPLADMLSSSWQQFVQTGTRAGWEEWLADMLNRPNTFNGRQPQFWNKTRFDRLVTRWGGLVGADGVTVISLADQPHDFVLRSFEELTGLSAGTLVPDPAAANISLGFGVAEVVRLFNQRLFAERDDAEVRDLQAEVIEFGTVRHLRRVPEVIKADVRIELPQWAADRAAEIVAEMNARIRASGATVIGDLDALTVPSRPPAPEVSPPDTVSTVAAAELLWGMMAAARRQGARVAQQKAGERRAAERQARLEKAAQTKPPTGARRPLESVPTGELLVYGAGRVRRGVTRRFRRH